MQPQTVYSNPSPPPSTQLKNPFHGEQEQDFCRKLKSYLHRLDETVTDQSPKCSVSPHDTAHLLNCNKDEEDLTVESLWTTPCEAAAFLHLDSDDGEA